MSTSAGQDNRGGIIAIVAAMAAFTISDTFTKLATATLSIGEVLAARGLIVVALFGVIAFRSGNLALIREKFSGLWAVRVACEMAVAVTFVSALTMLPIANLVSILQMAPLVLTAVGAVFLSERVGLSRWLATTAGFAGMLLIVKPVAGNFNIWTLLAVAAMLLIVLRDSVTRRMPRDIPSSLVTLTSAAGVMIAGLLMLPFEAAWRPPTLLEWSYMAGGAVFVAAAYYFSIEAVRRAALATIAPFRYVNLPFSLLAGWLIWREWPDTLALIGMAIIAGAGIFVFMQERRIAREARA